MPQVMTNVLMTCLLCANVNVKIYFQKRCKIRSSDFGMCQSTTR